MVFDTAPEKFVKHMRNLEEGLRNFGHALTQEGINKANHQYNLTSHKSIYNSAEHDLICIKSRLDKNNSDEISIAKIKLMKAPLEDCISKFDGVNTSYAQKQEVYGAYALLFNHINPLEELEETVSIHGFGDYFGQFNHKGSILLPNPRTYHTHLKEVEELKRKIRFLHR